MCRDFGISRKTGYKIFNRYNDDGLEALTDKSRRPVRYANQLPDPVEAGIERLKKGEAALGAPRYRKPSMHTICGAPTSNATHLYRSEWVLPLVRHYKVGLGYRKARVGFAAATLNED